MRVVLYRLRTELRAHGLSWMVLALVVGLGCGLVVAGVAGAYRAGSVAGRLARATDRSDAFVYSGYFYGLSQSNVHPKELARLPQVVVAGRQDMLAVTGRTRSGAAIWPDENADALTIYEPVGAGDGQVHDQPVVLAGRRPDPANPNEVMLDPNASRILGYGVGDSFSMRFANKKFMDRLDAHNVNFNILRNPATYRSGPYVRLHVVGVATDLDTAAVWLSPGFYRKYDGGRLRAWVRRDMFALRGGAAAIPSFQRNVSRIASGQQYDQGDTPDDIAATQAAVDLETRMVWWVTVVGALGMLALATTLLVRESGRESGDWRVMRALGIRQRQAALLGGSRGFVVGLVAAPTAIAVAVALSPLFPLGQAHTLEPAPGVAVDPAVFGVSAVVVVVVCSVVAALANWRISVRAAELDRRRPAPSFGATWVARLPLSAAVGLRAVVGRGAARTSVSSTAVGMTVAVAAAAAAVVLTSSFTHLLATPSLYGQNWDLEIGQGGTPQPGEIKFLKGSPEVSAFVGGATSTNVLIDGQSIDAQAMQPGMVTPTVISGRAPRAPNEILLAPWAMAAVHAHRGSSVLVSEGPGKPAVPMQVVGEGLLPVSGDDGADLTVLGLQKVNPKAFVSVFRVVLKPGVDEAAALQKLTHGPMVVAAPVAPDTVTGSARHRSMLYLMAAIAAAVALIALAHTLTTLVRSRRREFAILKAVGFVRAQLRMTVVWQGLAMALIALAIGLPFGIVVGRRVWTHIAGNLGVLRVTVTPALPLLAIIPVVLLVVVAVAAAPARSAARTRAAQDLRVE